MSRTSSHSSTTLSKTPQKRTATKSKLIKMRSLKYTGNSTSCNRITTTQALHIVFFLLITLLHIPVDASSSISSRSQSSSSSRANVVSSLINYHNLVRIKPHRDPQSAHIAGTRGSQLLHSNNTSLLHNICIGTSTGHLTFQHNKTNQYKNLAERYRNCTHVSGNLEIINLDKSDTSDMSFLESIREITGYLLIANVQLDKIRMPNLRIIRGRERYTLHENDFGMILIENKLTTLELPNLREILVGSVGIYSNPNLSHIRTITWEEILNPPYKSIFAYDGAPPEKPDCHPSCTGTCWGEGPEMCQKFSKMICNAQCHSSRCYGLTNSECCHSFCAGGCTGPTQSDCLVCKNFYDDGECKQECPSMQRYNPTKFLWEPDPNGKYAYGASCVKKCPEHLLRDSGACVRTCPPNKRSNNGECVPCNGPCQKNCQGVEVVHSGNIDQLINCTVIEGSITISDISFSGYSETSCNVNNNCTTINKYKPMQPNKLEVFKTLREISGYLNIQASHPDFRNLSYFSNLKTINGRQYTDMYHVLSIYNTSLVSLNLRSLRTVKGKINIKENQELCFADTIDWNQLSGIKSDMVTIRNNAPSTTCRQLGLQCHEQCAKDGCWGPGPDECLSCKNYKLDDYCVDNCTIDDELYGFLAYYSNEPNSCRKCHSECKRSCSGPEAKHCEECRNVKDGPYCVPVCPIHKYNRNGTCEECDKSCVGGCTGSSNMLGEGGCKSCGKAVINSTDPNLNVYCIRAEEPCPGGYYQEYVGLHSEGLLKPSAGRPVCRKCHHRCKNCTGMGSHVSVCECAKYQANEQCEDYCPRDYYADNQSRQCVKCSSDCNGCFGPTAAECITCKVYRIYYDATVDPPQIDSMGSGSFEPIVIQKFNCTAQCPPDKPHRISQPNQLDPYCSEVHDNTLFAFLIYTLIYCTPILLTAFAVIGLYLFYHKSKVAKEAKDKTVKLTMSLSGIEDGEPLTPSNMKPNLAPLRSIKETELRKGKILGSGFGGTVYQGVWFPEGHKPRPVAIKQLRDTGQSNMNKEFLDEAYIMASVDHPNLVRLLAVCMTPTHLMLVTQLMPLGCLLEYVQDPKNEISSKNLLEWCKQIARGMAYLEEHRMVHRDLALRNVLLQTRGRALISDFGLAKFLDIDQSEYQSGGGKLPIKWLAPECIRERKFTHKSDVWAFGVTIWELLTFGMRPFEKYALKDVPAAIEKGARLHQPSYMSAEVYKVMYACWFYNPEHRPNFKSLEKSFVNFARDPSRYLICRSKDDEYSDKLLKPHDLPPEDDELEYSTETDEEVSTGGEDEPTNLSAMPDLTPTTHNRLNEIFGFEIRRYSDQSVSNQLKTSTSLKKLLQNDSDQQAMNGDVFTNSPLPKDLKSVSNSNSNDHHHHHHHQMLIDANNNNEFLGSSEKCWRHSVSSSSLDLKSEQPTDMYDYLLPSPCTTDALNSEISHFNTFCSSSFERRYAKSGTSGKRATLSRNPPLSANHLGINNEEYFMRYINDTGLEQQKQHKRQSSNEVCHQLSLSNGNIPHSLV